MIPSSQAAVEYSLTPLGRSLQQPFTALVAWAHEHGNGIGEAQLAYDARLEAI